MRKTAIRVAKGPKIAQTIRERKELYENIRTRESIAQLQTQRFNDVWAKALKASPFYRHWAEQYSLPKQIMHIREVAAFPVLKKRDLVEHNEVLLTSESKSFYVSGGSTGEPTKFPRGKDEASLRYVNNVLTHSWLGLSPGDRYIHLWGHAHLFGQGRQAAIRKQVRKSKDWLVGGHRLNAYNQSRTDIQNWIRAIERIRPKYLVGYASALINLASVIESATDAIRVPDLKWIISTAETISAKDADRLQKVFGVPVAIEYGANETGVIAHSRPSAGDSMQLLWRSMAGSVDETDSLRLSTLDPRAFPLINYEIGDRIDDPDDTDHVLSFRSISGRTSEQLSLEMYDGTIGQINMIGVVGALKNIDGVQTVQAAQAGRGSAEIYVTSNQRPDTQTMKKLFLRELRITGVDVNPESLTFRHLEQPVKSIAGKTNLVVPRLTI